MTNDHRERRVLICHRGKFTAQLARYIAQQLDIFGYQVAGLSCTNMTDSAALRLELEQASVFVPVLSPATINYRPTADGGLREVLVLAECVHVPTVIVSAYGLLLADEPDFLGPELAAYRDYPQVAISRVNRQAAILRLVGLLGKQSAGLNGMDPNRTLPSPPPFLDAEEQIQPAILAIHRRDNEAAVRMASEVLRYSPRYRWAYFWRGTAHYRLHNLDAAEADVRRGLDMAPKDASFHGLLGNIYSARGDGDRAMIALSTAINLEPENADYHNNRSVARFRLGDFSGAVRDANQALAMNPRHDGAYDTRGMALLLMGRLDEAYDDFQRVSGIIPHSPRALTGLALAEYQAGNDHQAHRLWGRLVARDPGFARVEWVLQQMEWPPVVEPFLRPLIESFKAGC
jgi:tetratricopeptide (TPR) repeat protein